MTQTDKDRVMEGKEYRQQLLDKINVESSMSYTLTPEDSRDSYIRKLEEQIDELKGVIDQIMATGKKMKGEADEQLSREKKELETRYNILKSKLDDIRNAGDEAWKDLHIGTKKAWTDMAEAIRSAASKFL